MNHYIMDLQRSEKALWKVTESVIPMFSSPGGYLDVTYLLDCDYTTINMIQPVIQCWEWALIKKAKELVDFKEGAIEYCILHPDSFTS